jgi:uncharacterized protein (DUF2461 family)
MSAPAFSGFAPADLDFLRQLALNNDRDWFTTHRATYDDRLKPTLEALVAASTDAMAARGLPLAGNPKKSLFRIHRDTRFSNDKRPYKTHVSATLTRTGPDGLWRKMSPGMVYVHIEPEGGSRPAFDPDTIDPLDPSTLPPPQEEGEAQSPFGSGPFLGGGFYLSERPNIDAFRAAIVADLAGWTSVVDALAAAGLDFAHGGPVKRMPKGYEALAGDPLEPHLKRTRWLVRRQLTGAEIASPDLPDLIAGFAADARPLLDFGWKALDGLPPNGQAR